MRKLLLSLSLAAAVTLLAAPAFAQDKPLPPANPAQPQDKDLPKKNDLDKNRLPDRQQPRDDQKKDLPPLPEKPAQPAQPGAQPAQPGQRPGATAGAQGSANVKTQQLSGKIINVDNGVVVVRNDAGKEITLNSAAQTRFMIDGRPARLADFRVGSTINAAYFMDRDRIVLDTLVIGALPAAPAVGVTPAPQPTLLQGTVVRVIGTDQIVIKTADGKEMIVFVSPETKYQLTTQGGALADVTPNLPVQLNYEIIDRRPVVRVIRPWRR